MRFLLVFILIGFLSVLIIGCTHGNKSGGSDYLMARMDMVDTQIISRGVTNSAVIEAMRSVPRHAFVPEDLQSLAYADRPLPIGEGQTISQPYIVAFMSEVLELEPEEKVLEIGTGSGYQAAVLSELGTEVYSIEINSILADTARRTLFDLGFSSVHLRTGDGYLGWSEFAPYDAIIVTCAPSEVPKPLIDQLAENGRMIIPVDVDRGQELILLKKVGTELVRQQVLPVRFVPMVNKMGQEY